MADYTPAMARRDRPLWGVNIKRLLEATGQSATMVATKAGMKDQQFSNLTNLPDLNPKIKQLQRIADALGVPLMELFRTDSSSESAHVVAAPAAPDPETLRTALRTALADILLDVQVGLARQAGDSDESLTTARLEKSAHRDDTPRARGAVR